MTKYDGVSPMLLIQDDEGDSTLFVLNRHVQYNGESYLVLTRVFEDYELAEESVLMKASVSPEPSRGNELELEPVEDDEIYDAIEKLL